MLIKTLEKNRLIYKKALINLINAKKQTYER